MKKKNLKSLKLNKKAISNFNNLAGGAASMPDHSTSRFCIDSDMCPQDPITAGDCDLHTIGWDDAWYCLSWTSPDAWCGGR